MQSSKLFDLNVEQVLDDWEPEHAVREIIANALDEKALTNTEDIEIYKADKKWHIRDFGRGLQYLHFTQNENQEKLASPSLIGKFGVGLKDALAVFYRRNIHVEIDSKYAHITLSKAQKPGFAIQTLHAVFDDPKDSEMVGTDVILDGIDDSAIEKAKAMFLRFNEQAELLEETKYGEVYRHHSNSPSIIYINGVKVAVEENFLFSYNITNINAKIKKALNRERSNVGRSAYSDTVKNILCSCTSYDVLSMLVSDLENLMSGTNKEESGWVDIATYAAKTLNKHDNVIFMTPMDRDKLTNEQVEILKESQENGKKLLMVPGNVYSKIQDSVTTFDTIFREYQDTYTYEFVPYEALTQQEKRIFDMKSIVIGFLKSHDYKCDSQIEVSETIQISENGEATKGVYEGRENRIIVKRNVLQSEPEFLSVLLHEFAHRQHDYPDNSRDFENDLTDMLGYAVLDTTLK